VSPIVDLLISAFAHYSADANDMTSGVVGESTAIGPEANAP
jgi:hypothetical protein